MKALARLVALAALLTLPAALHAQTVFFVTTISDSGAGSLRQAILDANANPGLDEIHFDIPGAGVHTIQPVSVALPAISDPVVLDGATQPGASCVTWPPTLMIVLDGDLASPEPGLTLVSDGSTVRGFVIIRFGDGVLLDGADGNTLACNFVGTNPAGTDARPNLDDGIELSGGASGNVIGGTEPAARNLISGNTRAGVHLEGDGADDNRVAGNSIGVGADGATLAGSRFGVLITAGADDNVVGGTDPAAGNVIAGNLFAGVAVEQPISLYTTTGNAVLGNAHFANTGLGVDLWEGGLGPTSNDPFRDADDGPNNLQNFPEIVSATGDGAATLTVVYAVPSATPYSAYPLTVEVFLADANGEEGMTFLGRDTYDASEAEQEVSFAFTPAAPVDDGALVLATATDADGNTSEFSFPAVTVAGGVENEPGAEPSEGFALSEPSPNPTTGRATLTLTLGRPQQVTVEVLDALGRRVAVLHEGPLAAGAHALVLDARSLPSGVYVVRMTAGERSFTQRLTLVR
jgi:hypothetical protein